MSAPTQYRSTDSGAPAVSGTAGALDAALYAILVTGYGSTAAAGWSRTYTGTNKSVYRPAAGAARLYLRVDDSDARLARCRGYYTVSDVDTGVDPFPTDAQISGGQYFRKSVTADSTARPWIAFATASAFYMIIFGNQTTLGNFDGGDSHLGFGELVDNPISGDKYATFLIGASDTSATSTTAAATRQALSALTIAAAATHALAGTSTIPASQTFFKNQLSYFGNVGVAYASGDATQFPAYPDVGGKLNVSRIVLAGAHRGKLPGVWCMCHPYTSFTSLDTFSGASGSSIDGQTFVIVKTAAGALVFETTGVSW